ENMRFRDTSEEHPPIAGIDASEDDLRGDVIIDNYKAIKKRISDNITSNKKNHDKKLSNGKTAKLAMEEIKDCFETIEKQLQAKDSKGAASSLKKISENAESLDNELDIKYFTKILKNDIKFRHIEDNNRPYPNS